MTLLRIVRDTEQRRAELDAAVAEAFEQSRGLRGAFMPIYVLVDERETRGEVEDLPGIDRARQEAAEEPGPTGQTSGAVPGPSETRLHRADGERDMGRRYDRNLYQREQAAFFRRRSTCSPGRLLGYATRCATGAGV